jgi:phosphoribosylanthranilate isomerase
MRVRVKICGVTGQEALSSAVRAGADAIGFVFADSPRRIEPSRAAALAADLPPFVSTVAVFRHPTREQARGVLRELRTDWVQSDAEDRDLFDLPAGVSFLPVIRDGGVRDGDSEHTFALYEAAESGKGCRADWGVAAALAHRTRVILAGGLDPVNVVEAIRTVRPYGVDVSSGVERGSGEKDPAMIAAFVRAVRAAERELGGPEGDRR